MESMPEPSSRTTGSLMTGETPVLLGWQTPRPSRQRLLVPTRPQSQTARRWLNPAIRMLN